MKLCALLFVIALTCSVTDGLKCWAQLGKAHMKEQVCSTLGADFNACTKVDDGNGHISRTCAPGLYDGCKTVQGKTACFCKTNFCNTGSNTRIAKTFHFLMVSVAIAVTTPFMKLAFI